jgi:hypothetical protein
MLVAVSAEAPRSECVVYATDVVEKDSFLAPVVLADEVLGQLTWIGRPSDYVVGKASVPAAVVEGRLLLNSLGRKVKGITVCALRVHRSDAVEGHDWNLVDDLYCWAPSAGISDPAPAFGLLLRVAIPGNGCIPIVAAVSFVRHSRAIAAHFDFVLF